MRHASQPRRLRPVVLVDLPKSARHRRHPRCSLPAPCLDRAVAGHTLQGHRGQRVEDPDDLAHDIPVHGRVERRRSRDCGTGCLRKPSAARAARPSTDCGFSCTCVQHCAQYTRDIKFTLPRSIVLSLGHVSKSKYPPHPPSMDRSVVPASSSAP